MLFEAKILVATSTGLDSMVLTDLCLKSNLNIALAHCNFQLRKQENLEEEEFIFNFATQNSLQIFTKKFNTNRFAQTSKQSIQMAARQLRYEWFQHLAKAHHFDCILTAHHADDNLETFFINLGRASGIEGLSGIPKHKSNIVRPLLPFSREDILSYANEYQLHWCEDSSNASLNYQRNKLRHNVIPELKAIFPHILDHLLTTQTHLSSTQNLLQNHLKTVETEVCELKANGEMQYNIEAIKAFGHPQDYIYPLLKPYGFTDWAALQNLISAQSGKQIVSTTHRAIKNRQVLIVAPLEEFGTFEREISKSPSETVIPNWSKKITILPSKEINRNQKDVIYVDAEILKFPLTVRSWRPGDYFYPEGMTGKKKLSKFFKDEKLSLTDKSRVLVLCSDSKIVWVIGLRADQRFTTTAKTTIISKINFINATD